MNKINFLRLIILLLCLCTTISPALAQSQTPTNCSAPADFSDWVNCRVDAIVKARINQTNNTNQTESPSIAGGSTSLVDQSSASDLVGAALNLAGIKSGSEDMQNPSFTATASLYSLYAAAVRHDPLDPSFYLSNRNWRRFWFTLGQELSAENGNQRATISGFKILIINGRDASSGRNRERVARVSQALRDAAPNFAAISLSIRNRLYEFLAPSFGLPVPGTAETKNEFIRNNLGQTFTSTLSRLSQEQLSEIDKIVEDNIGPEITLTNVTREEIEQIRRGAQLALSFQTKLREADGIDEYRGETTLDYGVFNRVNLSLNGSFEYKDSKVIGGDKRGGRFAAESQFQISREDKLAPRGVLEGRGQFFLSFSYEGKWMTDTDTTHKAQGKLNIPIISGVNLPISITWANRKELIDESTVRGRFGFTFDLAKLASGLR